MIFRTVLVSAALLGGAVTLNAENIMELTKRQQNLVVLSALEARGDLDNLRMVVNEAFDNGLTINEIKEVFTQLYAYTGFPRALNAMGLLQQVLAERKAAGKLTHVGNEFKMGDGYDALASGTEVQTRLRGGDPFSYQFAPRVDYFLKAHLFGDIFVSDVLSESDREIVTVSAISALEGCGSQLKSHIAGALNMGVNQKQLDDIPLVLENKVGAMEAYRVRRAIAENLGKPFDEGKPVDFNVWPKGEFNSEYARFFIGRSYLASMDSENGGPVNVTFEPRCRNNWHIHHNSVQVIICVSGRGWYQEFGRDAIEMKPGSVIAIPAEIKHWHGAAGDSWFQHLAYTAKVGEGAGNEWLEPVTDDVYDRIDRGGIEHSVR